jgi:Mrp family chromosome partitioning ATPase
MPTPPLVFITPASEPDVRSDEPELPLEEHHRPPQPAGSDAGPEPADAQLPPEPPTGGGQTNEPMAGEPVAYAPPEVGVAAPIVRDDREQQSSEAGGERIPDSSGTSELAEIVASPAVRVALFTGAEGGEGAGDIAFSTARLAAQQKLRCILVDVGLTPSEALGQERPGLGELLAGEAAFGEVIRRDDAARVHVIPLGGIGKDAPFKRLQMVVGALTHTYDKVIVVAEKMDDWPNEHIRPDVAAVVCGPETTEALRTEVYDAALARGAESAIIVRYAGDHDTDDRGESEAA